jgi:hypothetical protein
VFKAWRNAVFFRFSAPIFVRLEQLRSPNPVVPTFTFGVGRNFAAPR